MLVGNLDSRFAPSVLRMLCSFINLVTIIALGSGLDLDSASPSDWRPQRPPKSALDFHFLLGQNQRILRKRRHVVQFCPGTPRASLGFRGNLVQLLGAMAKNPTMVNFFPLEPWAPGDRSVGRGESTVTPGRECRFVSATLATRHRRPLTRGDLEMTPDGDVESSTVAGRELLYYPDRRRPILPFYGRQHAT